MMILPLLNEKHNSKHLACRLSSIKIRFMGVIAESRELLLFFRGTKLKNRVYLISILLLAVVVVTSSTWVSVKLLTIAHDQPRPKEHKTEDAAPPVVVEDFTYKFEIEKISIPLSDLTGRKTIYAQFDILFDCPSEEAKRQMVLHRAQLRDSIFEVASGFRIDEFHKPEGFVKFKADVLSKISMFLKSYAPRQVILQNWLVY